MNTICVKLATQRATVIDILKNNPKITKPELFEKILQTVDLSRVERENILKSSAESNRQSCTAANISMQANIASGTGCDIDCKFIRNAASQEEFQKAVGIDAFNTYMEYLEKACVRNVDQLNDSEMVSKCTIKSFVDTAMSNLKPGDTAKNLQLMSIVEVILNHADSKSLDTNAFYTNLCGKSQITEEDIQNVTQHCDTRFKVGQINYSKCSNNTHQSNIANAYASCLLSVGAKEEKVIEEKEKLGSIVTETQSILKGGKRSYIVMCVVASVLLLIVGAAYMYFKRGSAK